jgi:iron complex transport system substrate-binding protein
VFCSPGGMDIRELGDVGRIHRSLCSAMRRLVSIACASAVVACGTNRANDERAAAASGRALESIELTDDAGQVVRLEQPAQRVISLVPSATETLIAIGAGKQIVARTRYDVDPEVAALPSVGGSVDPSIEAILSLHPDLVIAWESDKRQAIRQKLLTLGIPIFILRTQDTTDIFRGIASLGRLTAHDSAARSVAASIRATLAGIQRSVAGRPRPSVFYVVYNDPPMTAGPQTFIGQLISVAGARSIFSDSLQLWPNVAMEEIVRRDPDILVVPVGEFRNNSLERFQKLAGWRDLRAVREGHVVAVPADLVSRPSPSIARSARVLLAAFHPGLLPGSASVIRADSDTIARASRGEQR